MSTCGVCRIRKVRCDKARPCSACIASKFECTEAPDASKPSRKRKLPENDQPSNPPLLKSRDVYKSSTPTAQERRTAEDARLISPVLESTVDSTLSTQIPAIAVPLGDLPSISLADQDTLEFAGDSSLHAHSVVVRDLLVKRIEGQTDLASSQKMKAALESLRRIVETNVTDPSTRLPSVVSTKAIYDLELPPTDFVLELLRASKKRTTFTFSPPLSYVTREEFTSLCRTVFFRIEDYPATTGILVHGLLSYLIQEAYWAAEDPASKQQLDRSLKLCRRNLESCIEGLGLILPTTLESAQALLLACSHCMENSKASMCRKLVAQASTIVQMLGWHRKNSYKNDAVSLRHQKLLIFWRLYLIDKNLSLRLGQAAFFQEYDIDVPFPGDPDPTSFNPYFGQITPWARNSRMMGLVYQQLYSPAALRESDAERHRIVQSLLDQMRVLKPEPITKSDVSLLYCDLNFPPTNFMYGASQLVQRSDEVTYHGLLCMIYRASPPSEQNTLNAIEKCVKHARSAIECHLQTASAFKEVPEIWVIYLHWTLLNVPFVPFTALFSHVIESRDTRDLRRLQDFVASMSKCSSDQPAYKVAKLASVFVSIAEIYLTSNESQRSSPVSTETVHRTPDMPQSWDQPQDASFARIQMPEWAPFNPFLNSLGLADFSTPKSQRTPRPTDKPANVNLESWFNGNQHMMAMLEDDLSCLDTSHFLI